MKHCFLKTIRISVLSLLVFTCGCNKDEDDTVPPTSTNTTTTEVVPSNFDLYVSDAMQPWQIFKYNGDGTNPTVFIKDLGWPQDIVFLEDQQVVLVSNLNADFTNISRFNASTGALISDFANSIAGPTRMKIGKDNLLYVLQWAGDGKVLRFKLDGTFVDRFTKVGVNQSIGMDWDASGNLYVSSYSSGTGGYVRKFDPQGNDLGKFISTDLRGPTNIWFHSDGSLMVIDYNAGAVKRFDTNGNFVGNAITGLSLPEGVALIDEGFILIGNGGSGAVKAYNKDFKFVKDVVPAHAGGLIRPNAVVIRKNNALVSSKNTSSECLLP